MFRHLKPFHWKVVVSSLYLSAFLAAAASKFSGVSQGRVSSTSFTSITFDWLMMTRSGFWAVMATSAGMATPFTLCPQQVSRGISTPPAAETWGETGGSVGCCRVSIWTCRAPPLSCWVDCQECRERWSSEGTSGKPTNTTLGIFSVKVWYPPIRLGF